MSLWAVGISAAVTAGTAAYSANANKKNAKNANARTLAAQGQFGEAAMREAALFDSENAISFGELMAAGQNAARWNAGEGTSLANQSASAINRVTLDELEAGMARLFGGGEAFSRQRDAVNRNVDDWLAGRLSASTRAQVGRQALNSGLRALGGRDGAAQAEAAYLGLTTEGIAQQGVSSYGQLYSMYRNSFPLVTGAQTMGSTTINPAAAMQAAFQASQQEFEYMRQASNIRLQAAQGQLGALETANARLAQAQDQQVAANAAMLGAVGSVAGAYFAPTQGAMNYTTNQISPGVTRTTAQYQPGASMASRQWGSLFSGAPAAPPTKAPSYDAALGGGKTTTGFGVDEQPTLFPGQYFPG